MDNNIILKRYVSQKCLTYIPSREGSLWHMIAKFSDGKIYESFMFLKTEEIDYFYNHAWTLVERQNYYNALNTWKTFKYNVNKFAKKVFGE